MARSCKTLRNFFMLKASAHVWAASREALNIPDCPPDLSEPQYVDLLFMKGCYVSLISYIITRFLSGTCSCAKHVLPRSSASHSALDFA